MTEIIREKYARLIAQIRALEDRVEDLEKQQAEATGAEEAQDLPVIRRELEDLEMQLALKRSELSRISDGCGKPHPMQ
jgi:predicted  nucleic acid-binding Zn-ribbon protein